MEDIFGRKNETELSECLYNCGSFAEFDDLLTRLKPKWLKIESDFTKNSPSNKFVRYFEKYKQTQIREDDERSQRPCHGDR